MSTATKRHCSVCGTHMGDRARCPVPWCLSHRKVTSHVEMSDKDKLIVARETLKRIRDGAKDHAIWLDATYVSRDQLDEVLAAIGEE